MIVILRHIVIENISRERVAGEDRVIKKIMPALRRTAKHNNARRAGCDR